MKTKGAKWVLVTGIDNILVNIIDPEFIGLTIKQENKIASKSVLKKTPKESGGVFAKANNAPGIIEYAEIPEHVATDVDENGEYLYGDINIVNHLFNISAIEELSTKELPYHTAIKNCKYKDENGNLVEEKIYKFEKFIFDGFVYFKDISIYRVKREDEFAPIKNKDGVDSPETALEIYEKNKK